MLQLLDTYRCLVQQPAEPGLLLLHLCQPCLRGSSALLATIGHGPGLLTRRLTCAGPRCTRAGLEPLQAGLCCLHGCLAPHGTGLGCLQGGLGCLHGGLAPHGVGLRCLHRGLSRLCSRPGLLLPRLGPHTAGQEAVGASLGLLVVGQSLADACLCLPGQLLLLRQCRLQQLKLFLVIVRGTPAGTAGVLGTAHSVAGDLLQHQFQLALHHEAEPLALLVVFVPSRFLPVDDLPRLLVSHNLGGHAK
mmetsp:Transcript_28394/g.90374  ORF Transcript_28394/g.90374 Transcript_28394/m.90374 type:complete len:247 (+) Transcript_28394:959-1699(+)